MKHIRATLALGNSRTETVAFPCADSKIKKMLLHRTGDDRYTVYVDELTEPSWMKPIEKTYINIHEMNYLAKRMDAMDDNELAKMGAALSRFGVSDLPQVIKSRCDALHGNARRLLHIRGIQQPATGG